MAAGGKNGTEIKTAALHSIITLDSKTILAVLRNFLKTESDADLRKRAVTLLGDKYTREIIPLLEETQKSDPDAEVRKEAGVWLEKIRIRLIPVQVKYYAFETTVTDVSHYAKVPEGQVVRFSVPHSRPGSEARAKRAIERVFESGFDFKGSKATMNSAALENFGSTSRVSHRIGGFRIELIADSIIKTENDITGQIRFDDVDVPFKVDGAERPHPGRPQREPKAVMYLEMAPDESAEQSKAQEPGHFLGPEQTAKAGREPIYYSVFNIKGAVIHSNVSQMESEALKSNLFDYGQAKAEIPGPGGTWTLIGDILQLKKENILIGRRAKLIRPDGTTAAEGAEIRVPIGIPRRDSTRTERRGRAEAKAATESSYPLENGGWIRSPRPPSCRGARLRRSRFRERPGVPAGPAGKVDLDGTDRPPEVERKSWPTKAS